MGISALLRLKHKDIGALIVFCLIGWLIGNAIPDPTWAAYTAFLVCDHLFLGWLVFLGDNRARYPIPIEFIILIHIAFVVLVVVVVAARASFHYFSLFPYPMAALALWLLSNVVGYEKNSPEPVGLHRARSTRRAPERQKSRRSVRTRPATRASWPETASHPAPFEPAIPESAIEAPQPAASSVQPATEPSPSFAQTQPANGSPQPTTAGRQVLTVTESPMSAYQPLVSGIALELQPSMNPARPAPEPQLYRDNSIAEDLRRKYSEDVARIYPILVATAEDNEAWLRARGTDNPTHRKLGMSVRDEYEQWLEARVQARAARNATSQATPVGATCGGREGQPQQIQA